MNGGMGASVQCYVIASNTPASCPHAASSEVSRRGEGHWRKEWREE